MMEKILGILVKTSKYEQKTVYVCASRIKKKDLFITTVSFKRIYITVSNKLLLSLANLVYNTKKLFSWEQSLIFIGQFCLNGIFLRAVPRSQFQNRLENLLFSLKIALPLFSFFEFSRKSSVVRSTQLHLFLTFISSFFIFLPAYCMHNADCNLDHNSYAQQMHRKDDSDRSEKNSLTRRKIVTVFRVSSLKSQCLSLIIKNTSYTQRMGLLELEGVDDETKYALVDSLPQEISIQDLVRRYKSKEKSALYVFKRKAITIKSEEELTFFSNCPVSRININGIQIIENGISQASEIVSSLEVLAYLSDKISPETAAGIACFTNLRYLDLNSTNSTTEEVIAFKFLTKLERLNLSSCQVDAKGAIIISSSLPNLTNLNLWYSNIQDDGAKALFSSLYNLTDLNLGWNNLTDDSMAFLPSLKNLRKFYLSNNSLTKQGAKFISSLKRLEVLNIDFNNIGDEGVIEIAASLVYLKDLSLKFNKVTHIGTEQICLLLTNLEKLNLGYNEIGNQGGKYLLDFARENSSLEQLCIKRNNIKKKLKDKLLQIFKMPQKFEINT
ncbi:MAG: hypothetical protein BGO67_05150 [Alphaproteobacteria bacterium 41-28]|nr:MAG: hypothetical protein BGO67_05150 [Alphaproteobacteria bacterium 41-28]